MTVTAPKEDLQKITVEIPKSLLTAAQEQTGKGITQTVTAGLKKLRAERAYKAILAMKGKVDLELDLNELREDRLPE